MNVPYCYYPKNWTVYKYENYSQDGNNFSGLLKQTASSFVKNDLPLIKVETSDVGDSILRLKVYDPVKKRYEPPWPVRPESEPFVTGSSEAKLEIDTTKPGFKVSRASDGTAM